MGRRDHGQLNGLLNKESSSVLRNQRETKFEIAKDERRNKFEIAKDESLNKTEIAKD